MDIRDLLQRQPEELEQELKDSVTEDGWIHHKFMIGLDLPIFYHNYNQGLKAKKRLSKKNLQEGRFHDFVFNHERPYRLQAFLEIEDKLEPAQYWKILREVWIDAEFVYQQTSVWENLFMAVPKVPEAIMVKSELDVLESLPEVFTIYRGQRPGDFNRGVIGLSWSLSKKKAAFCAGRGGVKGEVISIQVRKEDVLAYINGRGEEEILLHDYTKIQKILDIETVN